MLFLVIFLPLIVLADKTCIAKPRDTSHATVTNAFRHRLCRIIRNRDANRNYAYSYGFEYPSADVEANRRFVCIEGETPNTVVCYCAYSLCGLQVVPHMFNRGIIPRNQFRKCIRTKLEIQGRPPRYVASRDTCTTAGACFAVEITPEPLRNLLGSTRFRGCIMTVGTNSGCYEDYIPGLEDYETLERRHRKFCICRPTIGSLGCDPDMSGQVHRAGASRLPLGINRVDL